MKAVRGQPTTQPSGGRQQRQGSGTGQKSTPRFIPYASRARPGGPRGVIAASVLPTPHQNAMPWGRRNQTWQAELGQWSQQYWQSLHPHSGKALQATELQKFVGYSTKDVATFGIVNTATSAGGAVGRTLAVSAGTCTTRL